MFISEACEVLKGIQDAVSVDAYINRLSVMSEVSRDAIYSEYRKKVVLFEKNTADSNQKETEREKNKIEPALIDTKASKRRINAEKKLILLMAENKKYFDIASREFSADDFSNEIHKRLILKMTEVYKNAKHIELSMLLNDFSGADADYASDIFYNMEEYNDKDLTVFELIKTIKLEKINEQISKETNAAAVRELVGRAAEIRRSNYNG